MGLNYWYAFAYSNHSGIVGASKLSLAKMILKSYDEGRHGALMPNLVSQTKFKTPHSGVFQVIEKGNERVFVQFERFFWKSSENEAITFNESGNAIWIRYFATVAEFATIIDALKIAVVDYLDVFYLKGVGIEFSDDEMDTKKFAEIVHGFRCEDRFDPFLKLQWKPVRTQTGIRFLFEPKR